MASSVSRTNERKLVVSRTFGSHMFIVSAKLNYFHLDQWLLRQNLNDLDFTFIDKQK